jgi:hypothetical protein
MARIRTIKPEFFLDDELADLSPLTRLLFIGLWTLADCEGRMEDRPKRIRAQILPFDDGDTDSQLQDLHQHGFIHRYIVEDKRYLLVTSFKKHQLLQSKESERGSLLPEPNSIEGFVPKQYRDSSGTVPGRFRDGSGTGLDSQERKGKERSIGREGKGMERNGTEKDFAQTREKKIAGDGENLAARRTDEPGMEQQLPCKAPTAKGNHRGNGSSRFDEFWNAYPQGHRQDRLKARKSWERQHLDDIADTIIADVIWRKLNHVQWQDGYIPHPTTFLTGRRWEDEIQTKRPSNGINTYQQMRVDKHQRDREIDEWAYGCSGGTEIREGDLSDVVLDIRQETDP